MGTCKINKFGSFVETAHLSKDFLLRKTGVHQIHCFPENIIFFKVAKYFVRSCEILLTNYFIFQKFY